MTQVQILPQRKLPLRQVEPPFLFTPSSSWTIHPKTPRYIYNPLPLTHDLASHPPCHILPPLTRYRTKTPTNCQSKTLQAQDLLTKTGKNYRAKHSKSSPNLNFATHSQQSCYERKKERNRTKNRLLQPSIRPRAFFSQQMGIYSFMGMRNHPQKVRFTAQPLQNALYFF